MQKEELLSVINEKGKLTGEFVTRTKAHEEGILHAASHVYIYRNNENGKIQILLQRRNRNKDSFPGKLDISSAGHVEHGMDFISTAQKELKEELGLTVKPEELQEAFKQRFSNISKFRGKTFNNQEMNIVYILKMDIDNSKLKLQQEEVEETAWMDAEEIYKRIENQDDEICISEEEFKKVLNFIKEKEKNMNEQDPNKEIYESFLFDEVFSHSAPVLELNTKRNKYGERRQLETIIRGKLAARIAEYIKDTDMQIANGIAIGIELGKPTFDEYGENFLKKHVPNYTKAGLGVALTKVMLNGINHPKCKKIIEGVESALNEDEELSQDTKCAIGAIKINDVASKFRENRKRCSSSSNMALQIFEMGKEQENFCMPELYYELEKKPIERDLLKRDPIRGKELEEVFKYYLENFSEVPKEFIQALQGYDKQTIVAYYVASKGEEHIHRIFQNSKVKE